MKDYVGLRLRDIAKMFAKSLPVQGQEFGLKVEEYLKVIKSMPRAQKIALTLLKADTGEEKLAYAIARCDWIDWWKKYKIRQHTSLESVSEDSEGNPVTLGELLVGEVEFENKINGKLDAERMFDKLPAHIKPIVTNRLIGKALISSERNKLNRFVKSEGLSLLLA